MLIPSTLLPRIADIRTSPIFPGGHALPVICFAKRPHLLETLREATAHLWPEDILRSSPARQYEFGLGRAAAALLLASFGCHAESVWIGRLGREPIWPPGYVGSISHTKDLLAVTVGPNIGKLHTVGLDIERIDHEGRALDALHVCFNDRERALLTPIEDGLVLGFSAKEALFKCLSREAGRYFDFLEVEINSVGAGELACTLLTQLSPQLRPGTVFAIHYRRHMAHVWTRVER